MAQVPCSRQTSNSHAEWTRTQGNAAAEIAAMASSMEPATDRGAAQPPVPSMTPDTKNNQAPAEERMGVCAWIDYQAGTPFLLTVERSTRLR